MLIESGFITHKWNSGLEFGFQYKVEVTDKNGQITGKIVQRYYTITEGTSKRPSKDTDYTFGTPSQVNNLFKKFGETYDCAREDQDQIEYAIEKYKNKKLEDKKASFIAGLTSLLEVHGLNLKLKNDTGGWGEFWGNATVVLEDPHLGKDFDLLEAGTDDEVVSFPQK